MSATAQVVSLSVQKRTSLINRLAEAVAAQAAAEALVKALKSEAIESLGEGVHTTSSSRVSVKYTEREIFDQKAAKARLTAAQLADCIKTSSYYDVRAKVL